jgi:hypothetical protein
MLPKLLLSVLSKLDTTGESLFLGALVRHRADSVLCRRVSIHTVTISHVLETSFDDTITKDEATERNQGEAAARSVVWDAQTLVESVTDADDAMKIPQPLGVKNDQGQLVDIRTVVSKEEFVDLRKKVGIETDPEKGLLAKGLLGHESLIDSNVSENENLRRAVSIQVSLFATTLVLTTSREIVRSYFEPRSDWRRIDDSRRSRCQSSTLLQASST